MSELKNTGEESLAEFVKKLPNSFFDRGLREGRKEGEREGKMEEKRKIAANLLAKGMNKAEVMEVTGLTEKEIEALD
ncbi:hypothetical protein SH601_14025 [Gracilibacillus sp. S3-1-1]|uniref:Uncharacterized protein n=1 Tax=Gracilibacillus pellucidus TaxID=3095368 RepID=A0ACC6M855_9BACI|nr:hypothetical protein [Gracilibacillus sp. S3-1-1]MDX8047105.1 hypothetical protein [Gracilibacillus sp. S3-1-1]